MGSDVMDSKPRTAAEALARWDAGETVFTVEMGGLGPGYEQVIHIMAFEAIRELLARAPLEWYWHAVTDGDDDAKRKAKSFADDVARAVMPRIKHLQSTGAQWGAAQNLAYITVRKGWATALSELPDDRLIQVSRNWPDSRGEASSATG